MKTIDMKPDRVVDAENFLGESPVWCARSARLYWINCSQPPQLHAFDTRSGGHRIYPMPERIGGLALASNGKLVVALARGLHLVDPEDGARTPLVDSPLPEGIDLHEMRCDRQGRIWVGSIDHEATPDNLLSRGSLFRFDGERLVPVLAGINCSNGLAISPDGKALYHSDSLTFIVNAHDLDTATGELSGAREFVRIPPEQKCGIDGATVDAEGGYWGALMFGGALRRYRPDGTLDVELKLPFSNPTALCFGGDDMRSLYLTTTRLRYGDFPDYGGEWHGGLYRVDVPAAGIGEPSFAA